ncbi:MAG: hypothetical protein OXC44_07470 [Proteobacteria bacterium]|nr:hypothetical protein [Pseudomonadota bacterium]
MNTGMQYLADSRWFLRKELTVASYCILHSIVHSIVHFIES